MSARGILDADMATIGRWLGQAMRWWTGELEQLLPARLRFARADGLRRFAYTDGRLAPMGDGKALADDKGLRSGERILIVVPDTMCLTRTIERPALSDHDLQKMAAFEGDSLLPFPSGGTLVAARRLGQGSDPSKVRVEMAGLPIATARAIADAVAEAKAVPARIVTEGSAHASKPLDFAPAMRDAALIGRSRSATPLIWGAVACLTAANIGAVIWRDVAAVQRLDEIVQAQQPALAVAQRITRRIAQDRSLATGTLAKRREQDAIAGLAAVSKALPEGVWLQRYVWDGPQVKLTGYKPAHTDVAGALRRSGAFADVRSLNDDIQAEVPAGEPFEIGARISGR